MAEIAFGSLPVKQYVSIAYHSMLDHPGRQCSRLFTLIYTECDLKINTLLHSSDAAPSCLVPVLAAAAAVLCLAAALGDGSTLDRPAGTPATPQRHAKKSMSHFACCTHLIRHTMTYGR